MMGRQSASSKSLLTFCNGSVRDRGTLERLGKVVLGKKDLCRISLKTLNRMNLCFGIGLLVNLLRSLKGLLGRRLVDMKLFFGL
jgi:hypothetical protein